MSTEVAIQVSVGDVPNYGEIPEISFPALTIDGEDPENYKVFYKSVRAAIRPKDTIEEFSCYDILNFQWDILRLRRFKRTLMEAWASRGVELALRPFMNFEPRARLAKKWIEGQEEAVAKVESLLERLGLVDHVIGAHTLVGHLDEFERLDRAIEQLEARRDRALRELDRRRATLARQLRQVIEEAEEEVEDAEYEDVSEPETKQITSEAAE